MIARIAGEYTTWENRFALERPDYGNAFQHVAGYYAHMYRLRGVPDERITAALEDERARLQREFIEATKIIAGIGERLARHGIKVAA